MKLPRSVLKVLTACFSSSSAQHPSRSCCTPLQQMQPLLPLYHCSLLSSALLASCSMHVLEPWTLSTHDLVYHQLTTERYPLDHHFWKHIYISVAQAHLHRSSPRERGSCDYYFVPGPQVQASPWILSTPHTGFHSALSSRPRRFWGRFMISYDIV